jgi:hypothetical protein
MPQRIISFSGRSHSGKTLLADLTTKHGYIILNFADEIKYTCCKLFGIDMSLLNNIKDIDLIKQKTFDFSFTFTKESILLLSSLINISSDNVIKVFPINYQIKSIRECLQKLGTDLIRRYNPDWHVNKMRSKIDNEKKYVIADARFINEINLIKELKGECWFIIRPNIRYISNHLSEISLNWSMFDISQIIVNNKDIDYLSSHWNEYMMTDCNNFTRYIPDFNYLNENKLERTCNYLNGTINLDLESPFLLENKKRWL